MLRFFFQDQFSQATKGLAKGSFFSGLFLIGFGMLVFVLRDLFAFLAAGMFFLAGFSAIGYAIRLFFRLGAMNRGQRRHDDVYRENVQIHDENHFD